jgi:hypothetical protein
MSFDTGWTSTVALAVAREGVWCRAGVQSLMHSDGVENVTLRSVCCALGGSAPMGAALVLGALTGPLGAAAASGVEGVVGTPACSVGGAPTEAVLAKGACPISAVEGESTAEHMATTV